MQLNIHNRTAYAYTGGKVLRAELPTLVLIHGAQNDHSVWALQSRYLANHGYNLIALDLPGHGLSAGPALSSVEDMADWVLAFLQQAGIEHAHLAGHSMGSLIALEASYRAPALVSSLSLIGTAYPMKVSDILLNAARDEEQSAIDMVNIWSHSGLVARPSCPAPGMSLHGMSRRLMQRIAARNPAEKVFHIDFSACNAYANGEAAAAAVRCPALFVLGQQDMMTPAKASKTLSSAIPHSQIRLIANSGHSLMSEQGDAVLTAMLAFLQGQR
ncbi:alpha/beta fold hydrolase [Undibacterium crateris]|uniref:alpha/beta fold hydrolase n=1 Tax=Undibacterium crateris TaxID=2528175 RepID=UPI001389E29D|nr:alpha/beta hydrolase [Undibacterium crateris]NDI84562.1 alpha/beta fold hydrolase [Undibacterium crateris]